MGWWRGISCSHSKLPFSIVSFWNTHGPGLASSYHPLSSKQSSRIFLSPKSIFSSKYSTSCNRRGAPGWCRRQAEECWLGLKWILLIFFWVYFWSEFCSLPHLAWAAMCNVFGSGLIQNFSLIGWMNSKLTRTIISPLYPQYRGRNIPNNYLCNASAMFNSILQHQV